MAALDKSPLFVFMKEIGGLGEASQKKPQKKLDFFGVIF